MRASVQLLGGFRAHGAEGVWIGSTRPPAVEMLYLLALAGRPLTSRQLAGMLWPWMSYSDWTDRSLENYRRFVRRSIAADVIVRGRDGWSLNADVDIDLLADDADPRLWAADLEPPQDSNPELTVRLFDAAQRRLMDARASFLPGKPSPKPIELAVLRGPAGRANDRRSRSLAQLVWASAQAVRVEQLGNGVASTGRKTVQRIRSGFPHWPLWSDYGNVAFAREPVSDVTRLEQQVGWVARRGERLQRQAMAERIRGLAQPVSQQASRRVGAWLDALTADRSVGQFVVGR